MFERLAFSNTKIMIYEDLTRRFTNVIRNKIDPVEIDYIPKCIAFEQVLYIFTKEELQDYVLRHRDVGLARE